MFGLNAAVSQHFVPLELLPKNALLAPKTMNHPASRLFTETSSSRSTQ